MHPLRQAKNRGNSMKINSDCLGCTDRTATCHSTCEKYKDYRQRHQKEKDEVAKGKIREGQLYGYNKEKGKRLSKENAFGK